MELLVCLTSSIWYFLENLAAQTLLNCSRHFFSNVSGSAALRSGEADMWSKSANADKNPSQFQSWEHNKARTRPRQEDLWQESEEEATEAMLIPGYQKPHKWAKKPHRTVISRVYVTGDR